MRRLGSGLLARGVTLGALAAYAAGCTTIPAPPGTAASASTDAIEAAYVVLGPDGVVVARAIAVGESCPAIEVDGLAWPMRVRAPKAIVPARPVAGDPTNARPAQFPVTVCEAVLPAGVVRASIGARVLPLPTGEPRRIVVLGDTGCRMKGHAFHGAFQACNDPEAWPFATVARAAAATRPDLVLHVGDYHYREDPCPPFDAGCAGSPWGYGWDTWRADLFVPGAPLLAAAPWIVVRGNHEGCDRAGQGWYRFLDPRPIAPRATCDDARDDPVGDYSESYAVPIGEPGRARAQFLVFDSSAAGLRPLPTDSPVFAKYRREIERAFALGARTPEAFFVNHHPTLAFAPNPASPSNPWPGNPALQSVLATVEPRVLFPPTIAALLTGHVHLFEVVSFSTGQPPNVVIGQGGTALDGPFPDPFPAGATPLPGAIVRETVASTSFGFLVMERADAGWTLTSHDRAGVPATRCTLARRDAACAPVGSGGR